jgi:hypothetical protein
LLPFLDVFEIREVFCADQTSDLVFDSLRDLGTNKWELSELRKRGMFKVGEGAKPSIEKNPCPDASHAFQGH